MLHVQGPIVLHLVPGNINSMRYVQRPIVLQLVPGNIQSFMCIPKTLLERKLSFSQTMASFHILSLKPFTTR